jgi:hypothetical protein
MRLLNKIMDHARVCMNGTCDWMSPRREQSGSTWRPQEHASDRESDTENDYVEDHRRRDPARDFPSDGPAVSDLLLNVKQNRRGELGLSVWTCEKNLAFLLMEKLLSGFIEIVAKRRKGP